MYLYYKVAFGNCFAMFVIYIFLSQTKDKLVDTHYLTTTKHNYKINKCYFTRVGRGGSYFIILFTSACQYYFWSMTSIINTIHSNLISRLFKIKT